MDTLRNLQLQASFLLLFVDSSRWKLFDNYPLEVHSNSYNLSLTAHLISIQRWTYDWTEKGDAELIWKLSIAFFLNSRLILFNKFITTWNGCTKSSLCRCFLVCSFATNIDLVITWRINVICTEIFINLHIYESVAKQAFTFSVHLPMQRECFEVYYV